MKIKSLISDIANGLLLSYSQIFFSVSKIFAALLVLITFIEPSVGAGGVVCALSSILFAMALGLNRPKISLGLYSFNALLTGLGIASLYQPSAMLYILIVISALMTLFITVTLEGITNRFYLPFLSFPFVLSIWIVFLASPVFASIGISEKGIYYLNELYSLGGTALVDFYNKVNETGIGDSLKTYFLSLASIFFQNNVLAGFIISAGLLIYSRIAFSLSLIGFYSAYLFFNITSYDITQSTYPYIGFNFILTAIAIGGFFLIPSLSSYLWTIVIIPVTSLITVGLSVYFDNWHLPVYSLPFNVIVLMFLYTLRFRSKNMNLLTETVYQQFMPERNLYNFKVSAIRNSGLTFFQIRLPFWGEWKVIQGQKGKITHKDEWQHAWDFSIADKEGRTYTGSGSDITNYLCYNKAVAAPAPGTVVDTADGVPDNKVGSMNIASNWGNTIIIKHSEFLYSKLSHLRPGTIKVQAGDFVKQGQIIASAGNSGRSPEPHLHFQLQSTPHIGSKTILYPLSHYIVRNNSALAFSTSGIPEEDTFVSNVDTCYLLKKAFTFIPGQRFLVDIEGDGFSNSITWEVITDIYNNTYIHCQGSGSSAYTYNDSVVHFFKHFRGNKSSLLYYFYLGCYKVLTGFYTNLELKDNYPLSEVFSLPALVIHDFTAPFFFFMEAKYSLRYDYIDSHLNPSKIILSSKTSALIAKKEISAFSFTTEIGQNGLKSFVVKSKNVNLKAIFTEL